MGGLLLVGPRRIGKTALLKYLCDRPPRGSVAVRVDLEGLDDVASAVERIAEAFWRAEVAPKKLFAERMEELRRVKVGGVFEVERGGVDQAESAWDALEALFDDAVKRLEKKQTQLVVMLDELPWWLDALTAPRRDDGDDAETREEAGRARARQALAQLRYLRQRDGLANRLRMVLTGSVGLSGLAFAIGASAELNDLEPFELRPLEEEDGAALFEAEVSARGMKCDDATSRKAHRLAGGSPHWIKQLAAKAKRQPALRPDDVDASAELLLSPRLRHLFQDEAHHHLERRHGERAPLMRSLLSAASATDAGATRSALLSVGLGAGSGRSRGDVERALVQLVDEFYLDPVEDRFRFANPLFRRWWERYGSW